jgi:hypothetical protein
MPIQSRGGICIFVAGLPVLGIQYEIPGSGVMPPSLRVAKPISASKRVPSIHVNNLQRLRLETQF